jgi:carbamoyltransferase
MAAPSQRIVGINRTQDASICVLEDARATCIQKERLSKRKHDWGKLGDLRMFYLPALSALGQPIDLLVECYSSDSEKAKLLDYRQEIEDCLTFRAGANILLLSHHLAHLYSAYVPSGFSESAAMVIDFMGSPIGERTEEWLASRVDDNHVEVASFYDCEGEAVRCLDKQVWDRDPAAPVGLGCFYFYLTQCFFSGDGNEGKVMALASYGEPNALDLPPLDVSGFRVTIPDEWLGIFNDRGRFSSFLCDRDAFQGAANFAAAGQRAFEDALLSLTSHLSALTRRKSLCYAGGVALNCVANFRLATNSSFESLFIPPAPGDSGTALGCALYGAQLLQGRRPSYACTTDFLGPQPPIFPASWISKVCDRFECGEPENLADAVADLLTRGQILGLWHGRSEFGPRALGHRSIIADPRGASTRQRINKNVKGRESFRPLGPIVIEEEADQYFAVDRSMPYMQYAVPVRSAKQSAIPAVVHVDATARVQTVSSFSDPFLYTVLQHFKQRTGLPILINTSFNGKQEPMVESVEDAIQCAVRIDLDGVVIPPYLLVRRR